MAHGALHSTGSLLFSPRPPAQLLSLSLSISKSLKKRGWGTKRGNAYKALGSWECLVY